MTDTFLVDLWIVNYACGIFLRRKWRCGMKFLPIHNLGLVEIIYSRIWSPRAKRCSLA